MGDTKKHQKQFARPRHPWIKSRILEEKDLKNEYGLKNNTELWKAQMVLNKAKLQAKRLVVRDDDQASKEKGQLLTRLVRFGFLTEGQTLDDVLFLTQRDILDRRLQAVVFKKKLSQTAKQARQFITHEHISIGSKVITSPSYLVNLEEEAQITFVPNSELADENHPERNPARALELKVQMEKAADEEAAKVKKAAEAAAAPKESAEEKPVEASE